MELWTLQHPDVYDELMKKGSFIVDPSRIMCPEFEDDAFNHENLAYNWLIERMDERLPKRPDSATYPIWAWYKQRDRNDGKPDMRSRAHAEPGSPLVRMRLEVPDELVLLSDFEEWNGILMYCHLSKTEKDSDDFRQRWKSAGIEYQQLGNFDVTSPELEAFRKEIVDSWELALDVTTPRDEQWHGPEEERWIQATFWELEPEYVKSVEHFIAR